MPAIAATHVNRPVWFDLSTTDLEGAKQFYGALFGWTYEDSGPEMGHYTMAMVNGQPAAAIAPKMPQNEGTPVAWTVYFGVTSAEATAARIRNAGGSMMFEPMDVSEVGRMAIAFDPDGATFGLWQAGSFPGARVEREHGSMAWCELHAHRETDSATFYAKVFSLSAQPVPGAPRPYHTLHQGETPVAGVMKFPDLEADVPSYWIPYFQVTNVDTANEVVTERGGELLHGPATTPYGRIMAVKDPQGAMFMYTGS